MDSGTPKPLTGNTSYEVLGVAKDNSKEEIKSQKESLLEEYREKAKEAKQESDNQKFKKAIDASDAIDSAWEWIRIHHSTNQD